MLNIWKGVESLLDAYAQIDPQDTIIILYTPDASDSAIWVSAELDRRGISYRRVWMNPLQDKGFEERLNEALPQPEELLKRLVILSFERDTMSHTTTVLNLMRRYPADKVVSLRSISAGEELFSTALLPSPKELESRNAYLLEHFYGAKKLRITTESGSDITIRLDTPRHRWISNRGKLKPGGTMILPAGEVATYPASVDGYFVADFAYNINTITHEDVRLHQSPVSLHIKNGKVTRYECDNNDIQNFLSNALSTDCSVRVGELGFGTNFYVTQSIPMNSHVNERRPGIHLGLGQHNQAPGVVDYQCMIHLDLIANGGLVWADDKFVVDLANTPPSDSPHPDFTTDEDVFSPEALDDCCGLLQCETKHEDVNKL